ncbi:hypothetical protein ACEVG1_20700 [Parapedobacter sp. 2B3]
MGQKTLSISHDSTTIRTTNQGIKLTSTGSNVHRLKIRDHGEVSVNPGQTRELPGIAANTEYKIELLTPGLGGEVIVDY